MQLIRAGLHDLNWLIFSMVQTGLFKFVQKGQFWKKLIQVWSFSCLNILFLIINFNNFFYYNTILCHGPFPFKKKLEHLFCLSHRKTRWIMPMNNVDLKICFLGTLNFMVTLTFVPWCKPKWSQDEFKSQSQTFQDLGTTSWSMA